MKAIKRLFWLIIPHRHDFFMNHGVSGIHCEKCGRVFYVKRTKR